MHLWQCLKERRQKGRGEGGKKREKREREGGRKVCPPKSDRVAGMESEGGEDWPEKCFCCMGFVRASELFFW